MPGLLLKQNTMQTVLTEKQVAAIARATLLTHLVKIAKKSIKRAQKEHPKKLTLQVCGPITSGGKGDRDANLIEFNKAVTGLAGLKRYLVFNQMPYEDKIGALVKQIMQKSSLKFAYCMDVLLDFYEPLFEKKYTDMLVFLPGWEASTGACWEYKKGMNLGIKTRQLKDNWEELLAHGITDIYKLTVTI